MPLEHMGLAPFLSQLSARLDALDARQLRALLLAHAATLDPVARSRFLAIFEEPGAARDGEGDGALLVDIAALVKRIRDGAYFEGWGWDDDLGDERGWGDESWAVEMDVLFDRAGVEFLSGDPHTARDAYGELLDALGLDEEVGTYSGPRPAGEMLQADLTEAKARALRLLYETTTPSERVDALATAFADWRYVGGRVGLRDIIDARPAALANLDALAEEWIGRFSPAAGGSIAGEERALLVEMAVMRGGPDAVGELAARLGDDTPELFVAWVDSLLRAGRLADAAGACSSALGLLPARGEPRAAIAERHATLVDTSEHRLECARVAWRAAPTALRLRRLAREADAATLAAEADALIDNDPGARLAAVLLVLAGRIDDAVAMLERADPLGWSRADHPGPVVVPFLLIAATAGARADEDCVPGASAMLLAVDAPDWREPAYRLDDDDDDRDARGDRDPVSELSALLAAHAALTPGTPEQRARWLAQARDTADARISAIVIAKHRSAYDRAALLATACAEAVAVTDGAAAAATMLVNLRGRYPRHTAFRSALDRAGRRSELLPALPGRGGELT